MPPPTAGPEITNGREWNCSTTSPLEFSTLPWSENLGAGLDMQDAAASAPLPIELVVACLLSQGPSQATTARHSGQWLAVSAMVWSYRLPVLIAGNGSKFQVPGPGGDSETANAKKNQERNASTQVSQTLPKQKVGDSAVRYRTLRTNRYQGNQGSIIEMRSRPPNTTTTTMMPRAATYAMRRHAGADMS